MNWKKFSKTVRGSNSKTLETATGLIDLKMRPEGGGVIEYFDRDKQKSVRADRVYLASGPVINAVLAHLLSGQSRFPMGNHWSRVVGKLAIKTPVRLGPFAKLRSTGKFVTYSLPSDPDDSPIQNRGFHHSIRLVPDGQHGSFRELRNSLSASSIAKFVRLRLGLPQSFSVLQMIDSGLVEDALLISSERQEKIGLRVKIEFEMSVSDDCLDSANRLVREFSSRLKPWASFKEISNPVLSDAAHYWGSMPMMKPPPGRDRLVVSQEFEISHLRGVFAPGASSFPLGAHGHPTFLALLTGFRIG
jgi:hypothetical protein